MYIIKKLYNLLETITDYALKELYDEDQIKKADGPGGPL
jgi:hypothetical protein